MVLFPLEKNYFHLLGYFFEVFQRGVKKNLTYEKLFVKN